VGWRRGGSKARGGGDQQQHWIQGLPGPGAEAATLDSTQPLAAASSHPPTGKKRGGGAPLGRPVICLANDLYAPALRPLRDAARVIHFKAPTQVGRGAYRAQGQRMG
jgi:chromosome transmission fidelity protein 18